MKRQILVTCALPYANGPLHLGHLLEHIQADIWVRYQRLRGHDCTFVCADDAHGTPIMLKARELGITPQQLVDDVWREHTTTFQRFFVEYDNYSTTHSETNRRLSEALFQRLRSNGYITTKTISQAYDDSAGMFLPDRFIKGTCPRCRSPNQYGDNCEVCGATYTPGELIDPLSTISGQPPGTRETTHYFFRLSAFADTLRGWLDNGGVSSAARNKLDEWFADGLKDWDITRDSPYFGFTIPGHDDKYFYVWLDAPVGYMASSHELFERRGGDFDAYWGKDSTAELYHFIGKDILYFHALFWPAMLFGGGYRLPTGVLTHGFVTVNGEKMSKSRGTFILASRYLDHLDPEHLRYYLASKMGSGQDDIDLQFDDFSARVNADIVGKIVNIGARASTLLHKHFDGVLADDIDDLSSPATLAPLVDTVAMHYEQREFSQAIRAITAFADDINRYINDAAPWQAVKQADSRATAQRQLTTAINGYRHIMSLLAPVLPRISAQAAAQLDVQFGWAALNEPLVSRRIKPFMALTQRVDPSAIRALLAN